MGRIILLLLPLMILSVAEANGLKCSADGTQVFYINGVNVTKNEFRGLDKVGAKLEEDSVPVKIDELLKSIPEKLDSRAIIGQTNGIYNYSNGFFNDVAKLWFQVLLAKAGNDPAKKKELYEEFIKHEIGIGFFNKEEKKLLGEYVEKSFDYIYDKKDGLKYEDGLFSSSERYEVIKNLNRGIADLVANAASDKQVVDQIKSEIKQTILTDKKKIIWISHSQGNEAMRAAFNELKFELKDSPSDLLAVAKYFGALQVAAPSPEYYAYRYRAIKLDRDLVISQSTLLVPDNVPVAPNYAYNGAETNTANGSFQEFVRSIPIIGRLWQDLDIMFTGNFFHNMGSVYLSKQIKANKILENEGRGPAQSMEEIFKENAVAVAESLESNCSLPSIKVIAEDAVEVSPGKFNVSGFAGNGRVVPFVVKDLNDSNNQTVFEITYKEYEYDITKYPFNIYTDTVINGSSASIPIPFASIDFYATINAFNPQTKLSSNSAVLFKVNKDEMPTIIHKMFCYTRSNSNGEIINTGEGEVLVGAKDPDSNTISLGIWYPNQTTGLYEGTLSDGAQISPFGYLYPFSNYEFQKAEYTYSPWFAGRSNVRIIYRNSDGRFGYKEVTNTCAN